MLDGRAVLMAKGKIYKTVVHMVMLYEKETIMLTKRQKQMMETKGNVQSNSAR